MSIKEVKEIREHLLRGKKREWRRQTGKAGSTTGPWVWRNPSGMRHLEQEALPARSTGLKSAT